MAISLWRECLVVAALVVRHSYSWLACLLVVSAFFASTFVARFARAETFRKGDVFATDNHLLYHYRSDGTLVQTFDPTGDLLVGATITSSRKLVTTHWLPTPGINIFDANGNEFSFDTPDIFPFGDVSVFSDGTLAINDQGDGVELYSQSGQYLGSITHPVITGVSVPFGSAIGPDDTLWLAMFSAGVARFSRDGTLLGTINPSYEVQDLAIDPFDGTLWIPSPDGYLHHLTEDGAELSSFFTAATTPFLRGIAVAADHTLYVTSLYSTSIYHYTPSGELLNEIELASPRPNFISVALISEPSSCLLFLCGLLPILARNFARPR